MSALLRHTSSGIPLSFIVKNELTDWLTQQPSFVQQWLANTDFEKSGLGNKRIPPINPTIIATYAFFSVNFLE